MLVHAEGGTTGEIRVGPCRHCGADNGGEGKAPVRNEGKKKKERERKGKRRKEREKVDDEETQRKHGQTQASYDVSLVLGHGSLHTTSHHYRLLPTI